MHGLPSSIDTKILDLRETEKPSWRTPRVDVIDIAEVTQNLPLPADDGLAAGSGS